ncbi:MAG: metallophosphoesterase family protein [Anaerolineales bacterium]|jgi:predicted phosphodiesterase
MRIAVFSDLHGNPYACRAVLHEIERQGAFDSIVAAGDLCFGGSDPAACVDMLRDAGVSAVYGNTDEFIFAPYKPPPDEEHMSEWDSYQAMALLASEQMRPEQVEWLASLPFDLRYSPTENPSDDLLVVHANPKNVHDYIGPPVEEQARLRGKIVQPDDDPKLVEMLADARAAVIAFGHLHYTSLRQWRQKLLVNVSPCSISPYDGDHRARFTIFTWETGKWGVERHYVDYGLKMEIEALLASDMPEKEKRVKLFLNQ